MLMYSDTEPSSTKSPNTGKTFVVEESCTAGCIPAVLPGTCVVRSGAVRDGPILKYQLLCKEHAESKLSLNVHHDDGDIEAVQWSPSLENELYQYLENFCRFNPVRTVAGVELALETASDKLTCNGILEFPTKLEVRHKVIKMRAKFLEHWNFVVSHMLPFNSETGVITTNPEYEPYLETESAVEKKFRTEAFHGYYAHHAFFLQADVAYLAEEQMYYFVRDKALFQIMDRFTWNNYRESWLFSVLVAYSRSNDVSTEGGLLLGICHASKQLLATEDQIRRLIRRRRLPFLHFKTFVEVNDLEESWLEGKMDRCLADHYHKMNIYAQQYYDNVNNAVYRGHVGFYIGAKAALTSEELEAHSFDYHSEDIAF